MYDHAFEQSEDLKEIRIKDYRKISHMKIGIEPIKSSSPDGSLFIKKPSDWLNGRMDVL